LIIATTFAITREFIVSHRRIVSNTFEYSVKRSVLCRTENRGIRLSSNGAPGRSSTQTIKQCTAANGGRKNSITRHRLDNSTLRSDPHDGKSHSRLRQPRYQYGVYVSKHR